VNPAAHLNLRRPTRAVAVALTACMCILGVVACSSDDTDATANRVEVLRNLSTRVVAPTYVTLDRTTARLADATAALCAAPDPGHLQAAQRAWDDAWQAWNRTRAFRFGPMTDDRTGSDITFMVDSEKIDNVLSSSDPTAPVPTTETLRFAGSDTRGLQAVQYLLFDRDATETRACAYAASAAALTAEAAHTTRLAWTDGADGDAPFGRQLAVPGTGKYDNGQAAVEDLVNGLAMALTEATRENAAAETTPADERESVGEHGGTRLHDFFWSIRASYFGTPRGTDGAGIDDLVAAVSPTADERVRDLIERSSAAVDALPASLADASKPELRTAYRLVRNAGTIVRAEVASELGVTLSLGDADGDS
jgi:predicted lipoprotein